MARFETPCQVVSLFVTAAAVAVILILFLNAEVRHRNNEQDVVKEAALVEDEVSAGGSLTFYNNLLNRVANQFRRSSDEEEDEEHPHRAKRNVESDYYSQFEIQGEYDDVGIADLSTPGYKEAEAGLSQSLISSSLNGHKIRNIKDKIRKLGEHSQLVRAVLKVYCMKNETVTYMMCYSPQTNTTTEDINLASENKTQSRHNYSDSVMKQVASMTSRLSPDDIVGGDVTKKCECHNRDTILYAIITTTLVNIVIFLAFSLMCSNKKKPGIDVVREDILFNEEIQNFKPILKEPDLKSPYECI